MKKKSLEENINQGVEVRYLNCIHFNHYTIITAGTATLIIVLENAELLTFFHRRIWHIL